MHFNVGEDVRVVWRGAWHSGRVVRLIGESLWEVAYEVERVSRKEIVTTDRLKKAPAPVKSDVKPKGVAVKPKDEGSPPGTTFAPGDAVLIHYKWAWLPGTIVRVASEVSWEIAYNGYSARWNEVVGLDRIRHAVRKA